MCCENITWAISVVERMLMCGSMQCEMTFMFQKQTPDNLIQLGQGPDEWLFTGHFHSRKRNPWLDEKQAKHALMPAKNFQEGWVHVYIRCTQRQQKQKLNKTSNNKPVSQPNATRLVCVFKTTRRSKGPKPGAERQLRSTRPENGGQLVMVDSSRLSVSLPGSSTKPEAISSS